MYSKWRLRASDHALLITAEEVAEICAQDGSEAESDIDSNTGGISSGEEFDSDQELEGNSDSEREWR